MPDTTEKAFGQVALQKMLTNLKFELDKKYSKTSTFTEGHLVSFDANGNLIDSGGTSGTGAENKIDIIQNPVAGNIPIINTQGMLSDSAISVSKLVLSDNAMTDQDIDDLIQDVFAEQTEDVG